MNEGWTIKTFSDISHSIEDGDWIEKKDQSEIGIRLIQTGNIGVGSYKDKSEKSKFISEDTFKRLKCTEIYSGDVLVSRLPDPVGRACLLPPLPHRCITAVDCSIIRLKDNEIHPLWFIYYTQTQEYFAKVRKECSGTTRNRITRKKLAVISIPIPPLSEQQRIVNLLDAEFAKIDALKANAEKNLQNAKDLFQAALKKELEPKEGWKLVRINDVYNFIDYRGATPTKLSEGIPLVTAKNVKMGFLDYTIKDFISKEEYATRQSRGISHKGDILFTTEAPLGNVAIADKEIFSAGQRVITFQQYTTSRYQALNKFYLYYLLSPTFQEELKLQATGLTALGIKASRLKEMKVPAIPLSEQTSIAIRLDTLNEKFKTLQSNYEKTITLCDDLKQALLRKAFNGEI